MALYHRTFSVVCVDSEANNALLQDAVVSEKEPHG